MSMNRNNSSTKWNRPWNRRSLHFKLLSLLLLAGIVVDLTVGAFYHFSGKNSQQILARNLENYAEYLIKDLGNPLDTLRAIQILSPLGLDLRYQGKDFSWATKPNLPDPMIFKGHHLDCPANSLSCNAIPLGWKHGRFMLLIKNSSGYFLFATTARRFGPGGFPLMMLLCFLTILFAIAFFRMRRMLKPIAALNEGVQQIGSGNLSHRITVCGHDEFAGLAKAFNGMAERLQEIIRSKEQLLLDVSHEMRSPLTRAKVALELPMVESNKESIREDLDEMEKMLAEILEGERLSSANGGLKKSDCDFTEMAQEIVTKICNQAPGIIWKGSQIPHTLFADGERIKVVIRNVLENALKYSKEGNRPVEIYFQESAEKTSFNLCIRDFGQGIPTQDLEKIFEPFYRVDRSRSKDTGGFGLGLSLCQKIILAHGGDILMESIVGQGSTVTIRLPMPI